MRIGMIFECGPDGADRKVFESLAKRLVSDLEIVAVTLDNKPNLIQQCGKAAYTLLSTGCEKVFIVWDLYPAWREHGGKPCRSRDRQKIFDSLAEMDIATNKVVLLCICEELEAWLISDKRPLIKILSKPTHQIKTSAIKDAREPDSVSNPKKILNQHFQIHSGRRYNDRIHAVQIAEAIEDWSRLKRSLSFARFHKKLTGVTP